MVIPQSRAKDGKGVMLRNGSPSPGNEEIKPVSQPKRVGGTSRKGFAH